MNNIDKDCCQIDCLNDDLIKIGTKKIQEETCLLDVVNYYQILGNDTRIKIILILDGTELCVCDIAKTINLSIPATSQQLKILKNNNFLDQRKDGRTIYYSLKMCHSYEKIKMNARIE